MARHIVTRDYAFFVQDVSNLSLISTKAKQIFWTIVLLGSISSLLVIMYNNILRTFDFHTVFRILEHCSFSTLVALSRINREMRDIVYFDFFMKRVARFLEIYIPRGLVLKFWDLLEATNASIAGSFVRCVVSNEMYNQFKRVNPGQLNIVIPNPSSESDAPSNSFRKWRRFMHICGYFSQSHSTRDLSDNFRASTKNWARLCMSPAGGSRAVSLIESADGSVFPPLFQASQTSSFYLMSSTRIYCLYPGLHERGFNLSLKPSDYVDVFDKFNYGLLNFRSTEDWEAFSGTCGEACPSIHRFTKNFPGWIVFRWGGFNMLKDLGDVVSQDDPYSKKEYAWKLEGECTKQKCENFLLSVDLYDEAI